MHHAHWVLGPALGQRCAQLVVEGGNPFWRKAGAHSRTRANPSAPRLVRVYSVEVERKCLDTLETRDCQVAWPLRINSQAAAELPLRIVLLDQLLRRLDHAARQRNPVEVRDHEPSARIQDAP